MDEVISRQEAIDALSKIPVLEFKKTDDGLLEALISIGQTNEALKQLPPVQPEQRWIPVTERLPEEDNWLGCSWGQFSSDVLVSILNSDDEDAWLDISHTIDGEWALELPRYCEIIAWMPLPAPYRKEGEADG